MSRPANFDSLLRSIGEALVADPDDLATYSALADLLLESGEEGLASRGEFIQVQLALEREGLGPQERSRLEEREDLLLEQHAREWLGELAPFLIDDQGLTEIARGLYGFDRVGDAFFARGWLESLKINHLTLPLARALRRAPEARLLRGLEIEQVDDGSAETPHEPADRIRQGEHSIGLCPLVGSPTLANLRVLRIGSVGADEYESFNCGIHSSVVPDLVRGAPKLEELSLHANGFDLSELFGLPLSRLRVLRVYHVDRVHRLHILAENSSLGNLEQLLLHPHHIAWWRNASSDEEAGYREAEGYIPLSAVRFLLHSPKLPRLRHLQLRVSSMGDEGCEEVVRSGILDRLKVLDLRHGRITDRGARILAGCPSIRNLERLDLDRNALSPQGVALIKGLGIEARVDSQHPAPATPEEFEMSEDDEYLYEGEFE
jgi:uncharacterized protein (TIGR02996 family)